MFIFELPSSLIHSEFFAERKQFKNTHVHWYLLLQRTHFECAAAENNVQSKTISSSILFLFLCFSYTQCTMLVITSYEFFHGFFFFFSLRAFIFRMLAIIIIILQQTYPSIWVSRHYKLHAMYVCIVYTIQTEWSAYGRSVILNSIFSLWTCEICDTAW